jgi:hypothetical protein
MPQQLLRKHPRNGHRVPFARLTRLQQNRAYARYLKRCPCRFHIEPISEFVSAVAEWIDWDTRTGEPWRRLSFVAY